MGAFRVYFQDADGRELRDHELNGKSWLASPGYIVDKRGERHTDYRDGLTLCDYSSMSRIEGERKVTLADFPGRDRVRVKVWCKGTTDLFWLVAPDHFDREPA